MQTREKLVAALVDSRHNSAPVEPAFAKTDIKTKHEHNLKYHSPTAVLLSQQYGVNLVAEAASLGIRLNNCYLNARKKFIALKFELDNKEQSVEFIALARTLLPKPFRTESNVVEIPSGYIIRLKH